MSEVRLTQSERQALVAAEHMTQSGCACEPIRDVVEAIIAGRLAAVEALADEWERHPYALISGTPIARLRAALDGGER